MNFPPAPIVLEGFCFPAVWRQPLVWYITDIVLKIFMFGMNF